MSCCSKIREGLSSKFSRSRQTRRTPSNESEVLNLNVSVESIRVVFIVNFFIMVFCAIVLNTYLVKPILLEGGKDGNMCGPFNGFMGDKVDPPVGPGDGFDIATQNHLVRTAGYTNICANWDYSPSREITAMIYPIFEYALLIYLCFDLLQTHIYFKKGWVSKCYYRVFTFMFVPMIIGCSWFRMIFVVIAYQNVQGHTAGFFGLQLTLVMIALINTYFIIDSKAEYAFLGGRKGTLYIARIYLSCILIISPLKLFLSGHIVFRNEPVGWSLNKVGGSVAGVVVDNIWFVFNAVLPLAVALLRAFSEPCLNIVVDVPPSNWSSKDGVAEKTEGYPLCEVPTEDVDNKDMEVDAVEPLVDAVEPEDCYY
eukprot:CAMPEP_0198262014 /NCGR_PEP_ID=MMETSP1447-20131203/10581_1 /TAXON_ID=420782 /ORGANISM="Chaetoceros dichaeta, Strain CCMP1751" /LENGTH=367 /DNA_ID=CAMNT_0043950083 /DNA_START=93 /DNA_END=1196 /DNA_ORIENTATION=+